MIEMLALLALTYQHQDRLDDALAALEDAVTLAEPGSIIRPFIELGPPMVELLNHLSGQHVAVGAIEQILAAFTAEDLHTKPAVSIPPEPSSASHGDGLLKPPACTPWSLNLPQDDHHPPAIRPGSSSC